MRLFVGLVFYIDIAADQINSLHFNEFLFIHQDYDMINNFVLYLGILHGSVHCQCVIKILYALKT